MQVYEKKWGREIWIVNRDYCGKKMIIEKGFQTSLHFHKNKSETFYLVSGKVLVEIGDEKKILSENEKIDISPEIKHRIVGLETSELIEFSTHHSEADTYRIEESCPVDKAYMVVH